MRIDRSHLGWMWFSLVVFVAATTAFIIYRYRVDQLNGPSGASLPGLTFGIIGTAFMVFAYMLTVRKLRVLRSWQWLGRAQFWMRGHIWVGLLALPMIIFHAGGFRTGGTITTVLMVLLYTVVFSGVIGALLQHFLPTQMTQAVPNETVFEQIDHVRRHLLDEAECIAAACGPDNGDDVSKWRGEWRGRIEQRHEEFVLASEERDRLVSWVQSAPIEGAATLKMFFVAQVQPLLQGEPRAELAHAGRATELFGRQRALLPAAALAPLEELERLCEQARQLQRQARWQMMLHAWLLVHVPLAWGLLVLSVIHIVVALRYSV